MTKSIYLLFTVATAMTALEAAAVDRPVHVIPSFLADVKTIKPGQSFHVGVLLRIDSQWHVYWENPGESGTPTRAKITAPKGIKADSIRYPLPKEFIQPGDLKGYGYEEEVMLITRVTVPGDWPVGKSIDLKADVSWLNCKDVCFPGKASLDLSINVGIANENDNSETFAKWHAELPLEEDDPTVSFTREGPPENLKLQWKQPVKNVRALPVPPEGVEVTSVAVEHSEKTTTLRPQWRYIGDKKLTATLGLLVTYELDGRRRGVRLNLPLPAGGG